MGAEILKVLVRVHKGTDGGTDGWTQRPSSRGDPLLCKGSGKNSTATSTYCNPILYDFGASEISFFLNSQT